MKIKYIKNTSILMMIISVFAFISCVGTVDDKNAKESKVQSSSNGNSANSFSGLQLANAISHDKIELFFYPATGDPKNLTYEIYVNNSPIPIKIGGRSLTTNAAGFYYFAISGLNLQTQYNFNMRVVEAGSETNTLQLDPAKSLSATTFSNETADFSGVSSLSLGAGEQGKNTILVKWFPATITGTTLNPKPRDPVGYEITYISEVGGIGNLNNSSYTGNDRFVIQTPVSFGTPPALNKDREYEISGLNPNTTYYVQVRAIHKAFTEYSSTDSLYKREMNTQFLKIKTLSSGALFDFNASLVYLTNPLGELGLTNLDVSWIPASGEFNHYRVCLKEVAPPGDPEPLVDYLQDSDIDAILNVPTACKSVTASTTNLRLNGLPTYAYYQIKVLACKNVGCDSLNRIRSELVQKRIITNVAPFTGILNVINPTDETKLKEVNLKFDAPVVSAGYLNRFKLYCYDSLTDTSPVEVALDGSTSGATGKINCDGIKAISSLPVSLSGYGSFDNITLELPVINGVSRYCFSLLPSIFSTYINQENTSNAVIRCFTPEIKTPNIQQFPGRNKVCSISDKSITLNWPAPTGGVYAKYVVLYREKTTPSSVFSFPDAVSDFKLNKTNNNALSVYKSVEIPDKTTLTHTINSLVPGRSYSIGVLSYLEDGATKLFSQYNLNIDDCTLPMPKAEFNEWVEIFAIGPKEDGLTPPTTVVNGTRNYFLETLDADGIPVEMVLLDDNVDRTKHLTPDPGDALASSRLGTAIFNGVYGAKDSKETNAINQYSNSGIVKIGWKDVTFYSGTEALNSYVTDTAVEPTPATKSSRKFGYKVYRSDDNQLTWIDLTKKGTQNKFQSLSNQGLLHPESFSWRKRNNASSTAENITFFTDYSVKFSEPNGEIDRARTYWYKIVVVFDGKELEYDKEYLYDSLNLKNPTHHIIRVTLPPRNMALVHRIVANRTMCLELDKTIERGAGQHYSCQYNGLGSSGLQAPWSKGNTVYDQGGDMLIDRFELSCPFSRGDVNGVNSDSSFNQDKIAFKGLSQFSNTFKGCYNNSNLNNYEPNSGTNPTNANYNYNQVIPGDCFGADVAVKAYPNSTACSNPATAPSFYYIYPGANGADLLADCLDVNEVGENALNQTDLASKIMSLNNFFPTQSEYAGVYYMRSGHRYNGAYVPSLVKGAGALSLSYTDRYRASSCSVNLPYTDATGEYRPRWIPVNSLFGKLQKGATPVVLFDKTMSQIRSNSDLYDGASVRVPDVNLMNAKRMTINSTLGRVVSSNSAKLPPLDGMSQSDLASLCSTYKVQVGVENSSRGYIELAAPASKRLMRRKESVVASSWPAQYNNAKVTAIESGSYTESGKNNSCNSLSKPANNGESSFGKTQLITPIFPQDSRVNPTLMVGSSSRDTATTTDSTEKCVSRFGIQDLAGNMKETHADEIFCDFSQDQLYLGNIINDVKQSVPYTENINNYFNLNNVKPWVLSSTASGSCSLNEAGASRTAPFVYGSTFNELYTYLGLNTALVPRAKTFDQPAILSGRNGDGSFLDFGQANLGPSLSLFGAISMEDPNPADTIIYALMAKYFNPVLGIPISCEAGCGINGSDNKSIISDRLVTGINYDTVGNPLNITMLDYPTNNAEIENTGVSEITTNSNYDSNDINRPAINYIDSIDSGADINDPLDNTANYLTSVPGTNTPGILNYAFYKVSRQASMKFYTGGSSATEAGRFSLELKGYSLEVERNNSYLNGGRCAIMINSN